ncbi:MAG: hypothetical protein ABIT16_02720 [Croceibacterium sp.]
MNHADATQNWMSLVIPVIVIAVVLGLRMRRMTRQRPLTLRSLWIVPGIYTLIAGLVFWSTPPGSAMVWGLSAAGLALGVLLGWQRGRMVHITVDPETGKLSQKASFAAMAFLLVLIAVRTGAREAAIFGTLSLDMAAFTDVLIALALGLLIAQSVEMYWRAKRLLDHAPPA